METLKVRINPPQAQFLNLPHKFKAYVGGLGSGKTWIGCAGICIHFWESPRVNQGYFAPTYSLIRDIFYPTIDEVATAFGFETKVNYANKEVHFYQGGRYYGSVFCRSMDVPEQIVGFKIGHALVDEIDLLKQDKAQLAWRKIIARMRYNETGVKNSIDVTTTPEGFRFSYSQFYKEPLASAEKRDLYGLVQASTYENERNLPEDYIPSLRASYPPQLIDAYIDGKFVNLVSGSVYPDFDRVKNASVERLLDGEAAHVGMDFNVYNCTAIVYALRNNEPHAVAEFTGLRDTPTMARLLRERLGQRELIAYPDATGGAHKSLDAQKSDITIVREYGFLVASRSVNPVVKDRIASMNAMILNGEGQRRLKVNSATCPRLVEALEQQVYDNNGEPDKTSGLDHAADAEALQI